MRCNVMMLRMDDRICDVSAPSFSSPFRQSRKYLAAQIQWKENKEKQYPVFCDGNERIKTK